MSSLTIDLTMSLDGYVAGPYPSLQDPLGVGGERLHEWAFAASSWQEQHGHEGGESGQDADVIQEHLDAIGASIMGRKMYSGGTGAWEDDPNLRGWWGDDSPFHHPVFVLTHYARTPLEMEGGTTFHFVTDGPDAALEQAREAAGGKDVHVAGGAEAVQQYLGLADTVQLHVAPLLMGSGTRLLDNLGDPAPGLELDRVVASPTVTHLRYRVTK
jgi:dihydrofolate reductase